MPRIFTASESPASGPAPFGQLAPRTVGKDTAENTLPPMDPLLESQLNAVYWDTPAEATASDSADPITPSPKCTLFVLMIK